MDIRIGIISPKLSRLPKTTIKNAQFIWFKEMEAVWAYLLNKPLSEVYIDPVAKSLVDQKYRLMIADLYPQIKIKDFKPELEITKDIICFPELKDVFEKGSIHSLYQPIVHASQETKIVGFECLSRFVYDQKNLSPEFIFNYAQEKLCIIKYDRLCIELTLNHAPKNNGLIFINVRPQTLVSKDFAPWLLNVLNDKKISADQLVLEITEQQCHILDESIKSQCQELKALGVKLAIDDFGTGLANLSLLSSVTPDFLKISGAFSRNVHQDRSKALIIKNILSLCESFHIQAVMECVETEEEWTELVKLGANYAQGFYFYKPMTAEEIKQLPT